MTSSFLTSKQPQWENISLNSNAPMLILRGGFGGKNKISIRKSLAALPDWRENVTFQAFGRQCTMRRRICQYSQQGKFTYSYSGLKNVEAPAFPPDLYEIKCKVESLLIEYILNNLDAIRKDLSSEFIELVKESAARSDQDEQRREIFSYRLHHIQATYRITLLSNLKLDLGTSPVLTNNMHMNVCIESTALRIITGFYSFKSLIIIA